MAKILVTGANGYIGKRLLLSLLEEHHEVVCSVRDIKRFSIPEEIIPHIKVLEIDLLKAEDYYQLPLDFDYAYFLVHSMAANIGEFESTEVAIAQNFREWAEMTNLKQIVFLSGLMGVNASSDHLKSRLKVEEILLDSRIPTTVLRAGIVVGSGSASFEIIRDLVEKLPLMITPRWVSSKTQPIAVRNVLQYLMGVLGVKKSFQKVYDIGGPDVLTYREMLLKYAEVRGLKRRIIEVPVMTPRLSSYWLYFVTATSYFLAANLVNSMKIDVVCRNRDIDEVCKPELINYKDSIKLAFSKVEQDLVTSSWKDAFNVIGKEHFINDHIQVPSLACYHDFQKVSLNKKDLNIISKRIWRIGGDTGWYYANFLWRIRGLIDKFLGGSGLRRGRTHHKQIKSGDALDFWRVIVADKAKLRLLLYAEMKMPGEAWLEFKLAEEEDGKYLYQTATFRPIGLLGRMYWYLLKPFHFFIFRGMLRNIVKH